MTMDSYEKRWHDLKRLDGLTEDQRQVEVDRYYLLVRQVVDSLPANASPRQVIKALRSKLYFTDRKPSHFRWLRFGLYRIGLGEYFCSRERPLEDPYTIYRNGKGWEWRVLMKRGPDDDAPYARWYCAVKSPDSESWNWGEVYARELKNP